MPARLELLDTVGYGNAGPKADEVKATREAAQHSDLLLLVVHAVNPARQADLDLLASLNTWFAEHPELKRPPLLVVMTHIDLLSPSLEWSPPYHWQQPTRPKEETIHDAAATVMEQLGEYVTDIVPICTAAGKVYGIAEELLPAVAGLMDEARGVALLRALRAEADSGKVLKIFRQAAGYGQGFGARHLAKFETRCARAQGGWVEVRRSARTANAPAWVYSRDRIRLRFLRRYREV